MDISVKILCYVYTGQKSANCMTYGSLYKLVFVPQKTYYKQLNKYYYAVIEQVLDQLRTHLIIDR